MASMRARTGRDAPERFTTARLLMRRPTPSDAQSIFTRYASDPDVTRYLAWPRHTGLDDTRVFLAFSDAEWRAWGCGPYLIFVDDRLVGSTGLSFESPHEASTGYLFARDSWGLGYATEALSAMVDVARIMDITRLYAICHVDHTASRRVMEKCAFVPEGVLRRHTTFPNVGPDRCDVYCYATNPATHPRT
jgi:RimJ/RimL family protein N-acetyltransferase